MSAKDMGATFYDAIRVYYRNLNLLIAPVYAWLYMRTADTIYRDRGDKVFAGGVKKAWLHGDKQFKQNYHWSFDYVKWRKEADQRRANRTPGRQ